MVALLSRPSRAAAELIVEEEQQLRRAIAKMLRKSGLASSKRQAALIEVLRGLGREFALILLDLTIRQFEPGSHRRTVTGAPGRKSNSDKCL